MEGRIRVAANAVVVRDGQVLLVAFGDGSGAHYNFPGGGVETGETTADAAKRETMEETCLAIEVERLLLVVESVGSRNRNWNEELRAFVPWNEVRFFFLARPSSPDAEPRLPDAPDSHQTGVRWLPMESLPEVNVLPQVSRELIDAINHAPHAALLIRNPHAIEHAGDA